VNIIRVDLSNFDRLFAESTAAIKDFLYMRFEIAGNGMPFGDWDGAELGDVDPYAYLDVAYEFAYQFRSEAELRFLRMSAALNLLCQLARIVDADETSGSTFMEDFRNRAARPEREVMIRTYHPELYRVSEAFESGRVIAHPAIHRAFRAALYGADDLHEALQAVTRDVVMRTFDDLA
jgi:hypothetical protein